VIEAGNSLITARAAVKERATEAALFLSS